MATLLLLFLLMSPLVGSEGRKKSSRTTHHQTRADVARRGDSREKMVDFDIPKRISINRKVHPPVRRDLTPVPMYRQDSVVGFDGEDLRSVSRPVVLHGGGGGVFYPRDVIKGVEAQNIDVRVRGCQPCCERKEGQRWPNWLTCFFACCTSRK